MDEFLSHISVQMLASRISNLTPSYWRKDLDNRPCARLYYIKKGEGYIRTFGKEFRLVPGRLYLIPPYGDMGYGCLKDLQIWWMHFSATFFHGLDLFEYLPCRVEWLPDDLLTLEKRMQRLLEAASGREAADQIEGTGLLLCLITPFFRGITDRENLARRRSQTRFLPVLKHIAENLNKQIRLEGLARIAFCEKSHFSSLFARAFGLAPMKYVARLRIQRIQMELMRTEATLDALAKRYGFHDAFHLSKAFKRATGFSPKDFRKAKLGIEP